MDAVMLVYGLADRIRAQSTQLKDNQGQLSQLSKQAVDLSTEIRDQCAALEAQGVQLPTRVADVLSYLESVNAKVLDVIQRECRRKRWKAWFMVKGQARTCAELSRELLFCSMRFQMVVNMQALIEIRTAAAKQDIVEARKEETLRALIALTDMNPGHPGPHPNEETAMQV